MILKRISILNYKNLEQVELAFSPKLNTFFGQNGMGKTNLLDAVYFLSFCKSAGNLCANHCLWLSVQTFPCPL